MKLTHPPGFYVLALVEIWERWSFYLMKALVVLYMTQKLGMTRADAIEWVGWYVGVVYATPIVGGFAGDRGLGPLRAVFLGGLIMLVGHLVMGIESRSALIAAMALIAAGSGFFKPNMQALVRGLYPEKDERLDGAFALFYVGINLGAFGAPWAGNFLRLRWGWSVAFGSAAVGLGIGLATLFAFRRFIVDQRSVISEASHVPLRPDVAPHFQAPVEDGGRRALAVAVVTLLVALYWGVANSDAGVLTLWVEECVEGAAKHAELYAGVNPACIFFLTPVITGMLLFFKRRHGRPVSTVAKLFCGMMVTLVACALLVVGARGSAKGVSWSWPFVYYAAVTVGELLVSPMSTALVAKIAPPRWASTALGVALLSSSIGGVVSGQLGRLWTSSPFGSFFSLTHSKFFMLLGVLPVLGIIACLVAWRWLGELLGEWEIVPVVAPSPFTLTRREQWIYWRSTCVPALWRYLCDSHEKRWTQQEGTYIIVGTVPREPSGLARLPQTCRFVHVSFVHAVVGFFRIRDAAERRFKMINRNGDRR